MAACLMARFLAISASNAASNPFTSDNASAMARCSAGYGSGMRTSLNACLDIPNTCLDQWRDGAIAPLRVPFLGGIRDSHHGLAGPLISIGKYAILKLLQ